MLQLVKYESVATVLGKCHIQCTSDADIQTLSSSISAATHTNNDSRMPKIKRFNKMTQEQVTTAKNISLYERCGKYGKWYGDHNEDGSLPSETPNSSKFITTDNDTHVVNQRIADKPKSNNCVLKFSNASIKVSQLIPYTPYSYIMVNVLDHLLIVEFLTRPLESSNMLSSLQIFCPIGTEHSNPCRNLSTTANTVNMVLVIMLQNPVGSLVLSCCPVVWRTE